MFDHLLNHRKLIIALFAAVTALCVLLIPTVTINYNLVDYLPDDSPSTAAIIKMEETFGTAEDDETKVMAYVGSLTEGLLLKQRIEQIENVTSVRWLDDQADLNQPESIIDPTILSSYYKDGAALFRVTIVDDGSGTQARASLNEIRSLVGDEGAISGSLVNDVMAKKSTGEELGSMMAIIIPLLILIMLLATRAWFEPVILLIGIAAAILINMGTNAAMGEISFVTQTAAAVLQLAVSMDYSIFLIHAYNDYCSEGLEPRAALKAAMKRSLPSILASGLTTVLGFAVLILMRFRLGMDMGIVLAKGVALSLISVLLLTPALILCSSKVLKKTHHRPFLPSFEKFSKGVAKVGIPVIILVALTIAPAYLAQRSNHFIYGADVFSGDPSSQIGRDANLIDDTFGKENIAVVLVPEGNFQQERALTESLKSLDHVTNIVSYLTTVGAEFPTDAMDTQTLEQFIKGGYSRIILYINTARESAAAFQTVEAMRAVCASYYDEYYLTGSSVNCYDMRDVATADSDVVTWAAILAIGMVILFTFRSAALPFLLLITIEYAIWLNLTIPYFSGQSLVYIGYMIISSIQLGATVDYAILMSSRYVDARRALADKKEAARRAIKESVGSIATSATILAMCGYIIRLVSSNSVISSLGELIGRGALLSAFTVVLFLPEVLKLFDRVIDISTIKSNFVRQKKPQKRLKAGS